MKKTNISNTAQLEGWRAAGAAWREALLVTTRSRHVSLSKTISLAEDKNLDEEEKNAGASNIVHNKIIPQETREHCKLGKTKSLNVPNNNAEEPNQTDESGRKSPRFRNRLHTDELEDAKKIAIKARKNRLLKSSSREIHSSSSEEESEETDKIRRKAYSIPQASKHLFLTKAFGSLGSKPKHTSAFKTVSRISSTSSSSSNDWLRIPHKEKLERKGSTHSNCSGCECKPNEDKTCNICLEQLRMLSESESVNDSLLNMADVSTCSQDESFASFSETDAHRIARLEEAGIVFDRPQKDIDSSSDSQDDLEPNDSSKILPPERPSDIYASSGSEKGQEADDEFECDCEACRMHERCDIAPPDEMPDVDDDELPNDTLSSQLALDFSFLSDDQRASDFLSTLFQNVIDQMMSVYPNLMEHEIPPASSHLLKELKKITISADHIRSEETCSICLCKFEKEEIATDLPCGHLFHNLCIDAWLRKSASCPVCRLHLS